VSRKIKKVLLLTTPVEGEGINPLPPLGLAYIGAVLEGIGVEVRIFDSLIEEASFEDIEEVIKDFAPDIVGVSNNFSKQAKNAARIYGITKRAGDIITIAGGAHPTAMPEFVLLDKNVDYVVLGEGEDTIVELIEYIRNWRNVSTLDGIGYKENMQIKIIPKTKYIEDLDSLPFPARHLLNMEKYYGLKASHGTRTKERFSPIVTSRGCPARCTFCSASKVWGKKFRSRSPENVVAEIKHLIDDYRIQEIMFEDDNFTLDAKRADRIFDLMIKHKLDVVWDTPNGIAAWTLTERLIDKMKASGCIKLNFPVETGSQYVMDNIIRKPLKLNRVKQLIKYAQNIGLDVGLFFVMGMPGETEQQIWDSFRFAKEMDIYFPHISIATPYPGSELYNICREREYLESYFSLNDLHIKSFCISTEFLSKRRLKNIYSKGRRFLLWSYFKKHPMEFYRKVRRNFVNKLESIEHRIEDFFVNLINRYYETNH
jgi:magnesium-protoporphyrin IX monomethyl ester (oxidative) cyclase